MEVSPSELLIPLDLMIEMDSLFRVRHAMQEQGFTLPAAPTEFHAGKIQIFRLSKIDRDSGEELVLYLSEEAVTKRLRQVEELRRACLSLADSSAGRDIQNRFKASQLVQRTSHALGR